MSVLLHNDEKCKKQGKSLTNASFSDIIILHILYVLETFSPHNFDYVVMPLLHNFDYVAGKFFCYKLNRAFLQAKEMMKYESCDISD